MTTPVLEALHNTYPLATIDIVTDARADRLFAHCPYRGRVVLKDKQAGWRGTVALLRQLRSTHYGLVVDLRTDGLTLLLRAQQRLTRHGGQPLGHHAVERHFGVISRHIDSSHIPAARVWLSPVEQTFADRQLSGLPGQRWLALGPGARWQPKRWPVECFRALVNQCQAEFDAVILLGDHTEKAVCQDLKDHVPLPGINLAGKTDLLQAAAILAQARLFVGNDSGPGHIAAATGTPTVTVFGPGDPARYHPWHTQARWMQSSTRNIEGVTVNAVTDQVMAALADNNSYRIKSS
ncbi:MAG: glycosyltransferase family 9 protein [Gammaproteobacteria bacterium]|nr:glycosyltransferase family 9 protein [Gammaproteobacteria bacterium]